MATPEVREEKIRSIDDQENPSSPSSSSQEYKLVPWLSWDEWEMVRESLFSSVPEKIAFSLERISTWRSRGCLPVVIDVTALIIEIQQNDPFFRNDKAKDVLFSQQMLANLYSKAILRLVNCTVEKTRKKSEYSIADAADMIGIPRRLIDIRHEGSHRDLPSLVLLRDSAFLALNWLRSYYWEPQRKQIPLQRHGAANARRKINIKLHELAYSLKVKQSPQLGSSPVKGKRGRHHSQACRLDRFLSLTTGNTHSVKANGSKKHVTKYLRELVNLYSPFPSEFASVIFDMLLEALGSLNTADLAENARSKDDLRGLLDDWKPVITKISNKKPEFLVVLLQQVLEKIKSEEGTPSSCGGTVTCQTDHIFLLFSWLVRLLKELKHFCSKDASGNRIENEILSDLLRKSLLSTYGDSCLMGSIIHLSELIGNSYLIDKLKKLSSLHSNASEETSSQMTLEDLSRQDDSIIEASKKLESIKLLRMRRKGVKTVDDNAENSKRWVMTKSWNSCPIGMLPRAVGSSGCLPVLDHNDSTVKVSCLPVLDHNDSTVKVPESSEGNGNREMNQSSGKRKADSEIQLSDDLSPKKSREAMDNCDSFDEGASCQSIEGHLLMNGIWKKVGEEEVQAIASAVRLLV